MNWLVNATVSVVAVQVAMIKLPFVCWMQAGGIMRDQIKKRLPDDDYPLDLKVAVKTPFGPIGMAFNRESEEASVKDIPPGDVEVVRQDVKQ